VASNANVHSGAAAERARASTRTASLITVLYFVGVYTSFSIHGSGGALVVPYAIANAAGLLGGLLYWQVLKRVPGAVTWVFAMLCILMLSTMVSAWPALDPRPRLLASAQMTMSVLCGVGALSSMLAVGRMALSKIVRGLAKLILAASLIEILMPREHVLSLYEFLYSWRPTGVYSEIVRDQNLWGWVRPLGLSTEPSFAGIFIGLFTLLDDVLTKGTSRQRNLLVTLLFLMTALLTIRSPTILCFVVLIVIRWIPKNSGGLLVGAITLVLGLAALVFVSVTPTGSASLTGGSFFARAIAPYAVAFDVAVAHSLFGLGVGSEADALPYVVEVWNRYGAWSSFSYFYGKSAALLITSNVAWTFIYLGAVGGLLFLHVMHRLLASIAGRAHAWWALISVLLIWTTIGGFVDARTWAVVFCIAGATRLAETSHTQFGEQQ
jgi:hypothetical protein